MVYDCFIFFNELDLLEIRLNELKDVVDKFVLVEADRTFQNNPKPFIFEQHKERFSQFLDKIIHVKLTSYPLFLPLINPMTPWKIEFYQRNSIITGLKDAQPEDVIIISDVDEIPDAGVIKEFAEKGADGIYGLKMDMYMYFLNNKLVFDKHANMDREEAKSGIWHCAAVMPFKMLKKKPNAYRKTIMRTKRRGEVYKIIPNAGWHFSYIGGFEKIRAKLEAFSHTEYNTDEYKNEDMINRMITSGQDIFGREMEFEIVGTGGHYPEYLKTEAAQQKYAGLFLNSRS